jgi:hypothetical protein
MADFIGRFAGISTLFIGIAMAQSVVKRLEFEVASVKPAYPSVRVSNVVFNAGEDLTIENVPLRKIVTYAYLSTSRSTMAVAIRERDRRDS